MRSFFVLFGLGAILLTIAIVVRSGMLMRENPGEPINAAMRQALAGVAYQWSEADSAKLAREYPGAIETPNGARYVVTRPGTGDATPQKGQLISVYYTARFFANGEKIDASADHGGPYNFVLGQPNVLPGWGDALHRMRKGEQRTLILPYWLAYGEKGQRGKIPGKVSIQLELELIDFKQP
ncbi:MAG: FKBP-type peptidyl-prolyl cis-trans isomerase [Opitutaceae bacterium]|nr:FKBP-type peptidyl-prolyl cis-trans isomerase [Opitutaceae bacterium]